MKKMLALHAFLVLHQLLAWRDGLVTGALTRPARLHDARAALDRNLPFFARPIVWYSAPRRGDYFARLYEVGKVLLGT